MTSATLTAAPVAVNPSAGALLKAGLTGGAIAAVASLLLYGAGRAAGVDFVAKYDPHAAASALPFFMPAVSSLVPSIFAALAMLGISRLTRNAGLVFAIV